MKILWTILIVCIFASTLKAQQVTSVDCCVDVGSKATIAVNDNTANNNSLVAPAKPVPVDNNGKCDFKLAVSSNTSAGVYDASDKLIRTLWNGVRYDAGCYSLQWDGLLDDGTQAPVGNYNIKILTNNVQYDWLGVLANSSTSHLQNEYNTLNGFEAIVATSNYLYQGWGYAERDIKHKKAALSDIGSALDVLPGSQSESIYHTAKNSNYIFWAGRDDYSDTHKAFFFATKITDDSQVNFSSGQATSIQIDGRVYSSVLGLSADGSSQINGIKANDNFVFVSRSTGKLEVYDLTNNSGALLQSINLGAPTGALAIYQNKLWVSINNGVSQYTINSNGTLSATGVTLSVPTDAMDASTTGELGVTDKSTQQVKFYNALSGSVSATPLGLAGGYDTNGPLVTNNKFMFYSVRGQNSPVTNHTSFCYQPDGSFWFFDTGNYRLLHFNSDKTYKEKISYVPFCRSINADPNAPTHVFADILQYEVDYSKVATDINSSWTLKYNWTVGTALDTYAQFLQVVTFPNGKTFATSGGTLYELNPASGAINRGAFSKIIEANGNVRKSLNVNNARLLIIENTLSGYDQNGTPLWGADVTIATTPDWNHGVNYFDSPATPYSLTINGASNPNKIFFYNSYQGSDFHLGSIKKNGTTWEWLSQKEVPEPYTGIFPSTGDYLRDGKNIDSHANIEGTNIFTHNNNELGRYTQVCYTNHFNEDGLYIGYFGTDNKTVGYTGDTRFWAGNSFKTATVTIGADIYYFYCDESKHGGIHIVKISNLSSVKEQSIPVFVNKAIITTPDPYSLMTGLPIRGNSLGNAPGWTATGNPNISTTIQQYLPQNNDIQVSGNTGDRQVSRSLGSKQLSSYTLSGTVSFAGSQVTFPDFNVNNYFALADQAGKQVAIVYARSAGIYINNTQIGPKYPDAPSKFSFTYLNGVLIFKFASYPTVTVSSVWDTGADISRPSKLLINQHVISYRGDYTQLSLFGLRFVSN